MKSAEFEKQAFKLELAEENLDSANELANGLQARLAQVRGFVRFVVVGLISFDSGNLNRPSSARYSSRRSTNSKLRALLQRRKLLLSANQLLKYCFVFRFNLPLFLLLLLLLLFQEKARTALLTQKLQSQTQASQEQVERWQSELDAAQRSSAENVAEVQRIGAALVAKEGECAALSKALKLAEETERDAAAQRERLQEQVVAARSRMEEVERQRASMQVEAEKMQREIDELKVMSADVKRQSELVVDAKERELSRLEVCLHEAEAKLEEEARKADVIMHQERSTASGTRVDCCLYYILLISFS